MKPFIAFAAVVLAIPALLIAFWTFDVLKDRRHSLSVLGDTPIFVGSDDGSCRGSQMTVVQQGTKLKVKRIRYWKDCATIDVALPDGRQGHIVVGTGNVRIAPPLD